MIKQEFQNPQETMYQAYEAPVVDVIQVEVEKGFAASLETVEEEEYW